jgi:serine protease Do
LKNAIRSFEASFMRRSLGIALSCLVLGTVGPVVPLQAQEKTGKNLLLALEDSLQEVIKQAEPSVACVLVSRSPIYKTEFNDKPPADEPGKLGDFDPRGKPDPNRNNNLGWGGRGRGRGREPAETFGARRYDLSFHAYVPEVYGSGLVIDGERLLILTTYHVVRDATKIYVRLPGDKGSYADILATSPKWDLAVLSLIDKSIKPLKPVKFGNGAAVKKGQIVVAIANPFAAGYRDGSPSASWGIVSNIQRRAAAATGEAAAAGPKEEGQIASHTIATYIRTDAQILAGSSGGALVNLNGEVIGLISSRAGLSGLEGAGGFAMPIDKDTKAMIDRMREGKEVENGFLGVSGDLDNKRGEGFFVDHVTSGGPASIAGISRRDCIVAINGTPIHDFDDLVLAVSSQMAGSEARLELREHHPSIVSVKLAKAYVPDFIASNRPKPVRGLRVDYTSVYQLKKSEQESAGVASIPSGVYVSEVTPNSAADNANITVNTIIVAVNGERVTNPGEFLQEAAKVPAGKPLVLTVANADGTHNTAKIVVP